MKGQPLAYNKDNQEDKEPLFDTVDTLKDTLRIFAEMMGGITVNAEAMESAAKKGYATATDLADYLVKKGVPFRDAHEVVAKVVREAQERGVDLAELDVQSLCSHSALIQNDVGEIISLSGSLNSRVTLGGTSPTRVSNSIRAAKSRLEIRDT
jgi:argininosuccinate lyase